MIAFFAFILAMFISIVLIPPLMRSASRLAFVDVPSERKVHAAPIPRIGGLAMVAGAITPILLWVPPSREVLGLLYGVAVILVFGLWDDRSQLDYRMKFGGQILAVCVVVFYGGVLIRFVPFCGIEPIPHAASVALTIFALLGVTNAINLADGLDGLAAGTTLLSMGAISLLAYLAGDSSLLIIAMAVMGAIIGFLRFNTHPAQVFMGDAGSQFLGFVAGVLVIVLTQRSSPILSPAMPLLLLGLPLVDTFLVMGQRLLQGKSPFKPDRNHIHHKLLALGLDHYESVVVIYALQATLVAMAFAFRFRSDLLNMGLFVGTLVTLTGLFWLAARQGWQVRRVLPEAGMVSPVAQFARRLKQRGVLTRGPILFAAVTMPLFGLYATLTLRTLPPDGGPTVFLLFTAAAIALGWGWRRSDYALLERLVLYVAITAIIFYWCAARPPEDPLAAAENVWFVALGVSLLVGYRFARNRSLTVTPTDFLIILIALLVPTFARTLLPQPYVGEVAIKTLVAFYAIELVLAGADGRLRLVRLALFLVLGALAARVMVGDITLTVPTAPG